LFGHGLAAQINHPKRQWPKIEFKERRGVTSEEHQKILACEFNPELHDYYEMLWHLAARKPTLLRCAQKILIGHIKPFPMRA